MNVSAIIVTRGQEVDLQPILDVLPSEWEVVAWLNGVVVWRWAAGVNRSISGTGQHLGYAADLSVYGRYAAIEHASHDLIYVQDDDVIVSDPQAIVDALPWYAENFESGIREPEPSRHELVANMPQEFRHDGYRDSCLVGFGAAFHRNIPARAFERFLGGLPPGGTWYDQYRRDEWGDERIDEALFRRTCDVVFTTLTPRVLVDVLKKNREFASDSDRMWRQPGHYAERTRMLELARQVRDA